MKIFKILFITHFLFQDISAQERIYDYVNLGKYQVGVMDTVIFDPTYDYNQFDYKGKKPYFIKIWHPLKKNEKNNYLKIKDLFPYSHNESLKGIQDTLGDIYKVNFIDDYLTENLETGNENNYGKHTLPQVLDSIMQTDTRSISATLKGKTNLPVILYYNGSQGHPFENFLLAEYFVSRGYVFIAAGFELQFGNSPFGMLPFERFHSNEYEESLRTVTRFAQSLTSSPTIYFIGHSFGAQMGLRTFGQDSTIKGMVSLETSIEFKTDYEKIKDLWPEVYKKIFTEKVHYPFPVLFCAATGEAKPFNFLENVKAQQVTYASTNKDFEHNAYLSLFYLRYFLDHSIQQSDKYIIKKRLSVYVKHLETIYSFIDNVTQNKIDEKLKTVLIR